MSFTGSTFSQSTSRGVTSTFQTLATTVFRSSLNKRLFKIFTTFRLWTLDFSTLFSDTNVFVAAIIDFVADHVFVKFTFWNFWAVPVETLDVTTFATVANSADIALSVPRFSEHPGTFVAVNAGWWLWGGWTFWAWGTWSGGLCGLWRGNTFIGVATWTWGEFFNVTINALDLVDVDDWATRIVTVARVGWAIALVLFRVSSEFHGKTVSLFAHWWSGASWSGFTFTVDDLFAAHVWISVSVDGDQMGWATVWIKWSSAFGFFDLHLFVFTAVVSFAFVRGFENVTDVDSGDAVFKETVFLWTWSMWTWSSSWTWSS
jgi:hypothetical protein